MTAPYIAGAVGGITVVKDITLSLDTNAYADGDLLADVQEIVNAMRYPGGTAILQSVRVLDKDDQAQALDLYFTTSSTSWGTENAAAGPSDAVADAVQGHVEIAASDYNDLANSQMATKTNLGIVLKAAGESTSLYVAAVSRGTGTYTASGITLKLGLLLD